jgi:hypothetical protein
MTANERAARAAAEVRRSRAASDLTRGVTLPELGVRIKGNEVRKIGLTWNSSICLGPLVGGCAGVMDVRPPSGAAVLSSIVIGNVPRVGTIFVAFADGSRHEIALRQGSPAQMRKVDDAVARFNAIVDVADQSAEKMPPAGPQLSDRAVRTADFHERATQARIHTAGLTFADCKPGRDAYKAARRAGRSREEASQASRDALARVKEAKLPGLRDPL